MAGFGVWGRKLRVNDLWKASALFKNQNKLLYSTATFKISAANLSEMVGQQRDPIICVPSVHSSNGMH
jgi:hypothetical protein